MSFSRIIAFACRTSAPGQTSAMPAKKDAKSAIPSALEIRVARRYFGLVPNVDIAISVEGSIACYPRATSCEPRQLCQLIPGRLPGYRRIFRRGGVARFRQKRGEDMPGLQTTTGYFNEAFNREHIQKLVANRDAFAPGEPLSAGLKLVLKGQPGLFKFLRPYIEELPASIQETLRNLAFFALSTKPPTPITFSWTPAYDFELTIWDAPDAGRTRGGITVLLKSRYPDDAHPVPRRPAARARRKR